MSPRTVPPALGTVPLRFLILCRRGWYSAFPILSTLGIWPHLWRRLYHATGHVDRRPTKVQHPGEYIPSQSSMAEIEEAKFTKPATVDHVHVLGVVVLFPCMTAFPTSKACTTVPIPLIEAAASYTHSAISRVPPRSTSAIETLMWLCCGFGGKPYRLWQGCADYNNRPSHYPVCTNTSSYDTHTFTLRRPA